MPPLIKWPGGKSQELNYIRDLIPPFKRYIEPFFGGGAAFFYLQPKKAIINDISQNLMDFYRFVKGEYDREALKQELYKYVENWLKIPKFVELFEDQLIDLYVAYKKRRLSPDELGKNIDSCLRLKEKKFNGLFKTDFCINDTNLLEQVIHNITSKFQRMAQLEQALGPITKPDLEKNIETAFRSGFYMHFRDILNFNGHKFDIGLSKKIANFYFIREFCYGSMFRYNNEGHFNIPYGGMAYNSKDIKHKVDHIFTKEVQRLFENTTIKVGDFETIFRSYKLTSDDFVFLDPPYDTDFSDYDNQVFDRFDQGRLAETLLETKAKFILIIKNTDFIRDLYSNRKGINIFKFDKIYLYNVKGRNDRETEHLVIYNYQRPIFFSKAVRPVQEIIRVSL